MVFLHIRPLLALLTTYHAGFFIAQPRLFRRHRGSAAGHLTVLGTQPLYHPRVAWVVWLAPICPYQLRPLPFIVSPDISRLHRASFLVFNAHSASIRTAPGQQFANQPELTTIPSVPSTCPPTSAHSTSDNLATKVQLTLSAANEPLCRGEVFYRNSRSDLHIQRGNFIDKVDVDVAIFFTGSTHYAAIEI